MAKTTKQILEWKDADGLVAFPVKSGETIYSGTFAGVDNSGYLVNLTAANAASIKLVVAVADDSANTTGAAATTSNGSISGSFETISAVAGDKTVRLCYTSGKFKVAFTAITQAMVGQTAYATDNFTFDDSQVAGVPAGTIIAYLSATSGWINLNVFSLGGGEFVLRGALTAATTTTGGGVFSVANPTAQTAFVSNVIVDVTTQSSGAATIDVGVAANGTTSSDTLIDGLSVASTSFSSAKNAGGTNGLPDRKWTSSQYITATASATTAGMVGTYGIFYRLWI